MLKLILDELDFQEGKDGLDSDKMEGVGSPNYMGWEIWPSTKN